MMKYELTCEKLDYDNTETRKAIWSILDFAKHETGFDAAIGKIRIEVYPEKSGGCAIYITKLKNSALPSSDDMNEASGKQALSPKEVCAVYKFDDLQSLLAVCRALSHHGYEGKSAVYFERLSEGGARYFLQMTETLPASLKKSRYLRENLFISEFGKRLESEEAFCYLSERCTPICKENALLFLCEKSGKLPTP